MKLLRVVLLLACAAALGCDDNPVVDSVETIAKGTVVDNQTGIGIVGAAILADSVSYSVPPYFEDETQAEAESEDSGRFNIHIGFDVIRARIRVEATGYAPLAAWYPDAVDSTGNIELRVVPVEQQ